MVGVGGALVLGGVVGVGGALVLGGVGGAGEVFGEVGGD